MYSNWKQVFTHLSGAGTNQSARNQSNMYEGKETIIDPPHSN